MNRINKSDRKILLNWFKFIKTFEKKQILEIKLRRNRVAYGFKKQLIGFRFINKNFNKYKGKFEKIRKSESGSNRSSEAKKLVFFLNYTQFHNCFPFFGCLLWNWFDVMYARYANKFYQTSPNFRCLKM